MGKKKNNNDGDNKNFGGGNGGGGGGERKEGPIVTVVLGLDMHCEGCATKIKKSIKSFSDVDAVKCGEGELKKLTVIGKLDPNKLREGVEKKVKKKVELISPAQNKKENNNNGNNNNNKGNSNKENNGNSNKENNGNSNKENHCKCCCGKQGEKKGEDNKKPKEPPVSTAVMKLSLHCQGCIQRIRKTVIKTKGYLDLTIDEQKGTITVKGAIEMKELAKTISTKLKRTVEILPQKKDGEKKGNENEREKEKEKEKENGGKGKGGGGGDNHARGGDNLIHYVQSGYPNPAFYGYGYGYGYPIDQQPSLFSDENPNACSVM